MYRWQGMVLAIIFWFKVDHCYPITSLISLYTIYLWLRLSDHFYRINIIHMTTSVSLRTTTMPLTQLFVRVAILLKGGKYLNDHVISNQRLSRACIVHLVIKRTKTMSCSGSHLGITINIKNTKFVKDLPMIDAQFRFNQCNSFREEHISVFSPYGLC